MLSTTTPTLLLTLLLPMAQSVITAPGPVVLSTSSLGTVASGSASASAAGSSATAFSSTSTCAAPASAYSTFCCAGKLIFPGSLPTGAPERRDAEILKRSEPNGIGRSHTVPLLLSTSLVDGVACFGSVATFSGTGTGTAAGSATGSATGVATATGSATGASVTSSGAAGSSTSASAPVSAAVSSIASSVAASGSVSPSATSTTGTGAAVRDGVTMGMSGLAGLLGLVMAFL